LLTYTLTDLRYLTALAEDKHFAKAAARCFVSQPTLSIAIKKLEDNLNITIFEREKHQVIVTPAGEQIIRQAHKILDEANQILTMAQSNQDPYLHPLRVGAIFTIAPIQA
jgi:LysR family hydrogen peroxide-inducible transcriptional activator